MCMSCFSNADFFLANGVLAAAAVSGTARRWGGRLGSGRAAAGEAAPARSRAARAARDERTAKFLAELGIEPTSVRAAPAAIRPEPAPDPRVGPRS